MFSEEAKVRQFIIPQISDSNNVQRKQIHNELVVERIVRQRTYDGMRSTPRHSIPFSVIPVFHSRCQYFSPPPSELWDSLK